MRYVRALALALVAVAVLAGCGGNDDPGLQPADSDATPADGPSITVEDAWVRATAGSTDPTMTAAFMVLYNEGSTDIALTGATADVADMTELHEMVKVDGKEMMQQVEEGITITAGRGKELAPGGYHVMMMGLNTDLAPGDEVTFTLTFSDGTEQTVHAPVKEFTEEEGHYHEPGTGEHSHDDEDS